jgi:hypothetical protein
MRGENEAPPVPFDMVFLAARGLHSTRCRRWHRSWAAVEPIGVAQETPGPHNVDFKVQQDHS